MVRFSFLSTLPHPHLCALQWTSPVLCSKVGRGGGGAGEISAPCRVPTVTLLMSCLVLWKSVQHVKRELLLAHS